ncbi:sulfurtransferase [Nocardioides sp. Soil805]|uniref:sulfurtransferase n=1 Tax=Nocardioides sp. Soil805 TaxID=1736416 RepID=UPI0012E3F302|nr:sulfurtransferase [Nocardioides sp. Soil805]
MADTPLISADELRHGLAGVTVLDVRYRMGGPPGLDEYLAGHVPSAAYVDLEVELSDPPADPVDERGRHPLPSSERFIDAMQRAGVDLDASVVVYDDWQGRAAARAWWLLRHHGHRDVRVLDGGWAAWLAAGGESEAGRHEPRRGTFHGSPGAMPVVAADDVLDVPVLVDARAPERYRGEVEPVDPVAGRIPGAVSVDTGRNLDNHGRFRAAGELRALYAGVGVTAGTDVAAYCGSGVTATHDILALEVCGIPAALYAASWSGWVADPQRPVERG